MEMKMTMALLQKGNCTEGSQTCQYGKRYSALTRFILVLLTRLVSARFPPSSTESCLSSPRPLLELLSLAEEPYKSLSNQTC
ncbi:hypothetical protein KC19_VG004500 [Ceratodon purpureus]|uniref:Uncharacterized protein n=1 Tax=Ceratodon purpureus TaxID=3225 RepID=A0A8T0HKS0_CERPU|nr:hypothetical protein KC19_VG004500 [Ceratodon purpureus]